MNLTMSVLPFSASPPFLEVAALPMAQEKTAAAAAAAPEGHVSGEVQAAAAAITGETPRRRR